MIRMKAALLFMVAVLGGCAAMELQQASDTENLLAAAGFHRLPADSAERQRDLASMPPREIVARSEDGNTAYAYADPQNCHCLYVGGPEAYARYRESAVSEKIARDMDQPWMNAASTGWGAWPSWDRGLGPPDWISLPDDF
jgi:hypothetical protein